MKTQEVRRKANVLFLDRDGVLNERPGDGYVTTPGEFRWIDGSLEGLRMLNEVFRHIVVVTNQQGVGKGLMDLQGLHAVHKKMMDDIGRAGARIDRVYAATGLRYADSFRRKPGEGMFLEASEEFPLARCGGAWMAGDTFRDMLFGKRLAMYTALIGTEGSLTGWYRSLTDFRFASLYDFANFMYGNRAG